MQEGKKSRKFLGKDMMNLLKLMRPEKKFCIIGMSIVGLNSALLLYLPQVTSDIGKLQELKYDKENKEKSDQTNMYYHLKWGGVCLLGMCLGGARRFLNTQISNRVAMRMRYSMFQNLMNTREHQTMHSQQLVHKLSNDVSLVSSGLSQDIFVMIRLDLLNFVVRIFVLIHLKIFQNSFTQSSNFLITFYSHNYVFYHLLGFLIFILIPFFFLTIQLFLLFKFCNIKQLSLQK